MALGKSSLSLLPKLLFSPTCQLGYLCTEIYWLFSFYVTWSRRENWQNSFISPVIPNTQVLQQLGKAVLAAKRLQSAAPRNIPRSMQNDIRVGKWPWLPTKGTTAMQHKTVQCKSLLLTESGEKKTVMHFFGIEPATHLFLSLNGLAVFSFSLFVLQTGLLVLWKISEYILYKRSSNISQKTNIPLHINCSFSSSMEHCQACQALYRQMPPKKVHVWFLLKLKPKWQWRTMPND